MKFIISTQELNFLINKVQNIVPVKPTSPILTNFLIEACNDELTLTATDLTVSIRCNTDVKILEEGSTTLPAKKLAQLVRELTAANVEVSSNSQEITTLVAGTSRFKVNGINKNEYPSLPDLSNCHTFQIKQNVLKDLLYRTSFAVSREDNRYILTGILMQVADGKVTFVGTDGKRLALAHSSITMETPFTSQSVIPLKAIDEFLKNLTDDEDDVKISILSDKVALLANQTILITKLLIGEYPDITRVIPESSDIKISLHREELISLLRQVSLFTLDTHHAARFIFTSGELKLMANTRDFGEGHVSMPVNYHGSDLEIAFNPGFFNDILRHCKEETVTLGLTDAYNPGIITDGEKEGKLNEASPLFVIMPMRLSEE